MMMVGTVRRQVHSERIRLADAARVGGFVMAIPRMSGRSLVADCKQIRRRQGVCCGGCGGLVV